MSKKPKAATEPAKSADAAEPGTPERPSQQDLLNARLAACEADLRAVLAKHRCVISAFLSQPVPVGDLVGGTHPRAVQFGASWGIVPQQGQ